MLCLLYDPRTEPTRTSAVLTAEGRESAINGRSLAPLARAVYGSESGRSANAPQTTGSVKGFGCRPVEGCGVARLLYPLGCKAFGNIFATDEPQISSTSTPVRYRRAYFRHCAILGPPLVMFRSARRYAPRSSRRKRVIQGEIVYVEVSQTGTVRNICPAVQQQRHRLLRYAAVRAQRFL